MLILLARGNDLANLFWLEPCLRVLVAIEDIPLVGGGEWGGLVDFPSFRGFISSIRAIEQEPRGLNQPATGLVIGVSAFIATHQVDRQRAEVHGDEVGGSG